ncbi:MAG: hypothetical protein ACJ76Y_07100 [Thermoanaerobaculia bacterium]
MIRTPRVCLVFVVIVLLALLVVPMAGARTVSSSSIHSADGGWVGAALRWVESLTGLDRPAHSNHRGTKRPVTTKTEDSITGTCIDPMGRPRPCF